MIRGVSVQSAGGPRLGGRPSTSAARSNGKSTPATCWPGWLGKVCTAKSGNVKAKDPQASQCAPEGETSPLPSAAVFTRQSPPSLPVRTSSARVVTGAMRADSTATKLRKAAMRFHKVRVDDDDDCLNTVRIIERNVLTPSPHGGRRGRGHAQCWRSLGTCPHPCPPPEGEGVKTYRAAFGKNSCSPPIL